jgi:uncharacterized protein YggT (Ycf19 family)
MLFLIHLIFQALQLIVIAGVILSWIRVGAGGARWAYHPFTRLINDLSNTICRPFSRLLEMTGINRALRPIDISPFITLLALQWIEGVLLGLLQGIGLR